MRLYTDLLADPRSRKTRRAGVRHAPERKRHFTITRAPGYFGRIGGRSGPSVQTFTANGTWVKPSAGKMVLVQVWGSAGGGARRSAGNGGGGGAGGYFERWFAINELGATETITIGAGGAVQSTDNTAGNAGASTSFGAHIIMFGGRGGNQAAAGSDANGGGSGGLHDVWTTGFANLVSSTSAVSSAGGGQTVIGVNTGQAVAVAPATGANSSNAVTAISYRSIYSSGGSGHATTTATSGVVNSTPLIGGGAPGAGNHAGAGANGASPAGGGGSGTTQGGSGGNGKIVVTVI